MNKWLIPILISMVIILANSGCASTQNNSYTVQPPSSSSSTGSKNPISNSSPHNSENSLRFIVLADSRGSDKGVNSTIVKKIMQEIKKLSPQPKFIIMPGDLVGGNKGYSGVKEQLNYFKKIVTEYYPEQFYYPGVGNHEMIAGKNGEKAFEETFSKFYANFLDGYDKTSYFFDVGDTRIFMLNSNHPGEEHKITGKQLVWLKHNIDKSKRNNIFLLHEPPYPTGAELGNSLDKYTSARDDFWKVVDSSNNPIVFCGHEHNYSRRLVNNAFSEKVNGTSYIFNKSVFQIISGGFGAPLYKQYTSKKNMVVAPVPAYHFTIVDVDKTEVKIQATGLDGKIIDSFLIH